MPAQAMEFLGRTVLGGVCPPAEVARLGRLSKHERYAAGEEIGTPEDLWLRVVRSGVVGLVLTPLQNRPVMVDILEPGDLLGTLVCPSFGPEVDLAPRYQALTAAEAIAIPQSAVKRCLAAYPDALGGILMEQRRRLGRLVGTMALAHERTDRRLLRLLLRLSKVLGPEVPLTRRALALAAGTTTETIIRILAPLARAGWISSRRGSLRVIRADRLRRKLEGWTRDDGPRRIRR